MKTRIYSKNVDSKLKLAMHAMCEFALARLDVSKRIRKNLSKKVPQKKLHPEKPQNAIFGQTDFSGCNFFGGTFFEKKFPIRFFHIKWHQKITTHF